MIELEQRGYKPAELGEMFHCHEKTILNEMIRGNLRHTKLPAGRVCFPEHIREYLEKAESKAAQRVAERRAKKAAG